MALENEKEKAFKEYQDTRPIVVSETWFNAGFDSGVKAERERVEEILYSHNLQYTKLWRDLFPEVKSV